MNQCHLFEAAEIACQSLGPTVLRGLIDEPKLSHDFAIHKYKGE